MRKSWLGRSLSNPGGRVGMAGHLMRLAQAPQSVAFAVCLFVVLTRSRVQLLAPDIWAEDGAVFLADAFSRSWSSLFAPYAGYFHAAPRLVAAVVAKAIPLAYIPIAVTLTSAVAYAGAASQVASRGYEGLVGHSAARIAMAVALCFVPGLDEIVGNLTNVHWILFVWSALILLSSPAALRPWQLAIVGLTALSAGESVLLIPLALARTWAAWREHSKVAFAGVATALLSLGAIANGLAHTGEQTESFIGWGTAARAFETSFVKMQLVEPLLGRYLTKTVSASTVFEPIASAACLGLLAACAWRSRAKDLRLFWLFQATAMLLPVMVWAVRPGMAAIFADSIPPFWAARHSFVPGFVGAFLWFVVVARASDARKWSALLLGLVLILHVTLDLHKVGWQLKACDNADLSSWSYRSTNFGEALRRRVPARVAIQPKGWEMVFAPEP